MKTKVLKVLEAEHSRATDDLHRANRQFCDMSQEELSQTYGYSSKTCKDVWNGYKEQVAEIESCINWLVNIK